MRKNKNSYNVLMIAPTSFFASYGCHVRILEEARVLTKMGHQVTVVTYHNGQDVEGLRIERTLPVPWRKGYEVGSSRHKVAFDLLLAAKCASLAGRRPDVIHAHLHEGVFAGYPMSLLWDVPLIFDFQGSMTSEMVDHHFLDPQGWLFKPWLRLEKTLNRLPQAILTSSLHAAQLLEEQFHVDASLITPIPDCVNADVFSPDLRQQTGRALRTQWGIPADRQVVAYLGLLAEYQGTGLLLQAATQVIRARPKTHFLIMGYPGVEHYRLLAHGMGLDDHVTFTGRVPYPEGAPRFLAMGDIAVAPKLSATEGSGKLLNYMSMAMPVVAFDTPVSREYMGEHGVYAPPGDTGAFAEALIGLLDDPQRATALGQQLRQRAVERYSWDWAGRQITATYERLLG